MKIACPHCGKRYDVPDSAVGKHAQCGNAACKQSFVVAASASEIAIPNSSGTGPGQKSAASRRPQYMRFRRRLPRPIRL